MLTHERNLKLDAFQRVDELQTQVCVFSGIRLSLLGEGVNLNVGKDFIILNAQLVHFRSTTLNVAFYLGLKLPWLV